MSSRSFSVGGYTRSIGIEDDPFNARVMSFRNNDASELSAEDQLTPEQIKAAERLAQAADQKQQDIISTQQNGDAFIAGHPEFIDSVANAKLLVHEMNVLFGEGLHPLQHFESAYESLRKTDFLVLNKAEVAKQQKAAAKQRYEALRAKPVTPSEAELDAMPLDEIRRLAVIENQQRMQREGETGGW